MRSYQEIKSKDPELFECFFAFSNQQFEEGVKNNKLEGKKILKGIGGLFGTQEGIAKLYSDYDEIDKEIARECDPQEVYNYEFSNHECSYTCNDREAFAIVESIFGPDVKVKRKYAYVESE